MTGVGLLQLGVIAQALLDNIFLMNCQIPLTVLFVVGYTISVKELNLVVSSAVIYICVQSLVSKSTTSAS